MISKLFQRNQIRRSCSRLRFSGYEKFHGFCSNVVTMCLFALERSVSFDVRICLLLIKALLARKELESTLNLSFLGSESKMHARFLNDDDDVAVFYEYVRSHINNFLSIFRISLQSYLCNHDILENIKSFEHTIDTQKVPNSFYQSPFFDIFISYLYLSKSVARILFVLLNISIVNIL